MSVESHRHALSSTAGRLAKRAAMLACAAAAALGPALPVLAQTAPDASAAAARPSDPFAPVAGIPDAPPAGDAARPDVRFDPAAETVEIHVSDANLTDVLRMLSSQSHRNIVASREVKGTVTCNLFDVTVEEALTAILKSNGYVARAEGDFIYVYTSQEAAALEQANVRQETRVFRLFHIPPSSAAKMIEPSLSKSAVVSFSEDAKTGVGSNREDAGGYGYSGGDRLIVRDYPDNLDEVEAVIAEVDQRPEQVLIEATILSTKLSENNSFGVDFNVVGGVDFSQFSSSNGQITGGQISDTAGSTPYGVGTGNNFSGPVAGGLKLGLVSNNVSAFVAALEGTTDTTVLANPKVLALNKQRGEVLVGREDGYLTTTLTETTATQQVEFLSTGTRLIFRPFVSRDGFIRLEIHPEDSQGGLNSSNLPFKTTTEVTSNVMVKDGRTIVIGGLFRESATTGRSQIPVLGNIPILGAAFRRQSDATTREEIIILLTPHIVKDHDAYAKLSDEELKRAEKLRVGQRRGMMPTGRERMAQANYERAVREMAGDAPDRRRALYFLNSATNLNPSFIEAIELRERLTGEVIVEADQSTIRSFVRRSILQDVRGNAPVPQRPERDPLLPAPQDVLPKSGDADPPLTPSAAAGDAPPSVVVRPTSRPAMHYAGATSQPTTQPLWVDTTE